MERTSLDPRVAFLSPGQSFPEREQISSPVVVLFLLNVFVLTPDARVFLILEPFRNWMQNMQPKRRLRPSALIEPPRLYTWWRFRTLCFLKPAPCFFCDCPTLRLFGFVPLNRRATAFTGVKMNETKNAFSGKPAMVYLSALNAALGH